VALGGLTKTTISPSHTRLGAIGSAETPGLPSDIGVGPFSPSGFPGTGVELSSSEEGPGECTGISSSSQVDGLNKSGANTPRGGVSRLDSSRARALAALLSHRRICWSSKLSIFSSSLLTSCR
jgi:hypothetical protein